MFLFSSWKMVFITLGQRRIIPDGFVYNIKNKNSFSIEQYTVAKLNFGFLSLKMTFLDYWSVILCIYLFFKLIFIEV